MTPIEEERIRKWARSIEGEITLSLVLKQDKPGRQMRGFCEDLVRLVPRVRVDRKEGDEDQETTEIRVRPNIRYRAVPHGRELEPFLEAVKSPLPLEETLPSALRQTARQVDLPALIEVYVSPRCPFCPTAVSRCLSLADANPKIQTIVVDATLFPALSAARGVRSLPTVVLDGQFRWTGTFELEDLVEMLARRDPAGLGADSLRHLLDEGRAEALADMMADRGMVFPAFTALLTHPRWPVRLGAMVTFEHLVVKRPDLSPGLIQALWERFADLEDPVKGDVLYLFGQSGEPAAFPLLEAVLGGSCSPELREAAEEALESLAHQLGSGPACGP
jgi:glutaredoxin